jgi:protein-S-isoprenylcysteine O-methyltransferase Ste14
VRAGGILIAFVGLLLGLRSALLLTGRGRPRRGPSPALVLAGPYLRARNPLFAGLVLVVAGAALAARSWILAVAAGLIALAAHVWVVRAEEPRLRTRFGKAYAEYTTRVPRWLPRLGTAGAEDETSEAPERFGVRSTE